MPLSVHTVLVSHTYLGIIDASRDNAKIDRIVLYELFPCGVIGNTPVSGTGILGSSPGGGALAYSESAGS